VESRLGLKRSLLLFEGHVLVRLHPLREVLLIVLARMRRKAAVTIRLRSLLRHGLRRPALDRRRPDLLEAWVPPLRTCDMQEPDGAKHSAQQQACAGGPHRLIPGCRRAIHGWGCVE
jgi:hypothetical protein